ncbi:MAG: class I SAM-dependent rRNA methyltransferase [Persephonella sp.]|nr:MAG: class I SAM-dependent rRNA methyltransferase [Persephonella sp.]RUM62350.1 MAG: class I SAM-dependent rRNA methyltransferase [Persephonella sp.]
MKKVIVKNNVIPKLKRFFPWVYRNELKKIPKNVKSGELISIFSSDGKFLGIGYINLNSVITVRVLSFNKEKIDIDFFKRRIVKALEKRNNLKNITNGYRIIHSEADFLPGLIVDFYDNYLSIQINTAGMENFRQEILSVLIDLIKPKGIYEKSDKKSREKEGLKTEEKTIYGSIPNEIIIYENNLRFVVDLTDSQKTGFYLDQRKNRMIVSNYSEGKILDLFSNSGGFGIYSYHKGADFVKFVDISPNAIKHLKRNCEINKIKKNYSIVKEDVFDFLKREEEKGEKYDLIIIDRSIFPCP